MTIQSRTLGALLVGLSLVSMSGLAAAAERSYTEGSVVNVASIRTEPGMFDEYMRYLAGPYKQMMEEQKSAGIILDYRVYAVTPRSPDDPDIYLLTTYRNMAALDGLQDKVEPIQEKMFGDAAQRRTQTVERGKLRSLIGSQQLRKLELK
jgi:hypothetical protein